MKPLEGVRVLDLSQYLPGPLCCQMLADFGAEVIKVEPLQGELGRMGNPQVKDNWAHFYNVNRNKKSLALDLKANDGKEIFKRLVKEADVVFEQYRPETMNKLGLGYEELRKVNKRIIYCAVTGYGYSGPLKMAAGHDLNYVSLTGILGISGTKEAPGLVGTQIADIAGGTLHAVIAILLALKARETTGEGQFCDIGMADGCATMLAYTLADYWGNDRVPQRSAEQLNGGMAYYNLYETADGKWISLGAIEPKFWTEFCQKVGHPEWIPDRDNLNTGIQEKMIVEIRAIFKQKTQQEWVDTMADQDICFMPVLSLDQSIEHPQIREREIIIKADDFRGTGKTAFFPGVPIKLSATPGEAVLEFSDLGQDSRAILSGLGYSENEIEAYITNGIIK